MSSFGLVDAAGAAHSDRRPGVRSLLVGALGGPFVSGAMDAVEVLVVYAFGSGDARVSVTNEQLAAAAMRWPDLPVLAQSEPARALAARGRTVIDVEAELRARTGVNDDAYVDTAMITAEVADVVRQAGWERVGIIAHPAHTARCAATVATAGLSPVVPDLGFLPIGFDESSTQWWTRRRGAWAVRELAVVAHQVITGTIVPGGRGLASGG